MIRTSVKSNVFDGFHPRRARVVLIICSTNRLYNFVILFTVNLVLVTRIPALAFFNLEIRLVIIDPQLNGIVKKI